jgi:biopolymer transport protein TolR
MGEINVVPYIDVMLVLLIIFMVTAPLLTQGIEVNLPKAAAAPLEAREAQPLVLSVDAAGRYYMSVGDTREKPVNAERVVALASAVLRGKPDTPVLVKADEGVAYGKVVFAMVLLQQAGASKIGFLTDPPDPARLPKRRA